MTQVTLPITSRTTDDANNFSDVYDNDAAIAAVVNGQLGEDNFPGGFFSAINATSGIATVTHSNSCFSLNNVVTHGLGTIPSVVMVSLKSSTAGITLEILARSYTSTQFQIDTCAVPTPAGNANFTLSGSGFSPTLTIAWFAVP